MLTTVRRILDFEMTIAEWIGAAIILSVPYLIIGMVWAFTHLGDLSSMPAPRAVVSFMLAVLMWPVPLITNICMG